MFARSWRDCHFDRGILGGESGEVRPEEVAECMLEGMEFGMSKVTGCVLHAPTAAGPVAVVEVEALALEDEGADAVLCYTYQ